MQCCLVSVQQKGEVAKERRSKNVLEKGATFQERCWQFQLVGCPKFAQNKGKTLCTLLVFTQLLRTKNKERSIFRLVYLGF